MTNVSIRNEGNDVLVSRAVSPSPVPLVALKPAADLFSILTRMLYLGPFRNAVNVGGSGDYYDIQIGQPFIMNWRRLKTGYQKEQSESGLA